jgi:hypothetical protein
MHIYIYCIYCDTLQECVFTDSAFNFQFYVYMKPDYGPKGHKHDTNTHLCQIVYDYVLNIGISMDFFYQADTLNVMRWKV